MRRALKASIVACCIAIFIPLSADAALPTCDNPSIHSYYHEGYEEYSFPPSYQTFPSSMHVEGGSAQVTVRGAHVCPNSSYNDSHGSVRIHGLAQTYLDGWAEAGFLRYGGSSTLYNVVQHSRDGNAIYTQTYGGSISPGGVYTYKVAWEYGGCPNSSNNQCFKFYIGGALQTTTDWDPYQYWDAPFDGVMWVGKEPRLNSDIPGTASSPLHFTNLMFQRATNDLFASADTTYFDAYTDGTPRWQIGGVLTNTFNVYCYQQC